MDLLESLDSLIDRLDARGVRTLALMGSYARGEAGPYSDVDVVRFVHNAERNLAGAGSYLHEEQLVVVSDVTPAQVEQWFSEPEAAVNVIMGLRHARPLRDPAGHFMAIQARADAFVWDAALQERANRWASERMVGWVEEVHKGLEGLRRGDIGRLLNARFGLSWGLSRVMTVQRGVLLLGDNAFYEALSREMGLASDWVRLWHTAFGIEDADSCAPTLREQVIAGLRLYALTAELLRPVLRAEDEPLITHTRTLVRTALSEH
jgi:predicted nucleotidyltransferase